MAAITFDSFDSSPYQRVPPVNVLGLSVLAKALLEALPAEPSESVQKRSVRLQKTIAEIEDELTNRRRAKAPAEYGVPVELDGAFDGLWALCFRSLELLGVYQHSGLDPFIAKPDTPLGASLAEGRKKAERAAVLLTRLFGSGGLSFTRMGFRDQSETSGAILRLVKEDALVEELSGLVGAAVVEQLIALQEHYETMVVHQLTTSSGGVDLRDLRRRLVKLIEQYNGAVLDMLDEDEPESLDVVLDALRPMITLRELLARGGKASSQGAGEPENQEEAQLEAELEAALETQVDDEPADEG